MPSTADRDTDASTAAAMRGVDCAWRLVVLSTHFDDAVLSVGGHLAQSGAPQAVVTVHGGAPPPDATVSGWDADCGFRTASEAHRTRREEDRLACALVGADQLTLANPDNPYREATPLSGLRELLDSLGPQVQVAVPLSTNQPDHRAVRDAALEALGGRDFLVYADLPYAPALVPDWLTLPVERVDKELEVNDPGFRELVESHELELLHAEPMGEEIWSRKRQAIFAYASQLSLVGAMGEVRHLGPLLRHPGCMQRELIWRARSRNAAGRLEGTPAAREATDHKEARE
ncbi:PIG-L deacetylase family protein [Streptomyces diastaticus]|uniref:PIG-L deacetylase family protein n=1 Tax=Streptomyces diastaticus TaxID=1956 RepID=UPI00364B8E67